MQELHTEDLRADLREVVNGLGTERALVLTTPSRRHLEPVLAALEGRPVEVFDEARVHVPAEVVERALAALDASGADTVIALGGGAAVGLAKALRLSREVRFVAVPTTYAASEQTSIHGVKHGDTKRTGRDPRALPDVVVYDPRLSAELPRSTSVQSLLNAMAHPVSALSTGALEAELATAAHEAAAAAYDAALQLLAAPESLPVRAAALRAAARCGAVLERAKLGFHHRAAHLLGGRFDLPHAATHAVLLPHTVHELALGSDATYAALRAAVGVPDLPAALHRLLARADAPTSLTALGLEPAPVQEALADAEAAVRAVVERALLGGRPSAGVRLEDWGGALPARVRGPAPADADRVVLALHGRGSNALDMLVRVGESLGDHPRVTVIAPQAPRGRWYAKSYRASAAEHGEELTAALATVESALARLDSVEPERVFVFGFSQGACLATEAIARSDRSLGGLVALGGARIGPRAEQAPVAQRRDGMPVVLGGSVEDRWVPPEDIATTAADYETAGAAVRVLTIAGGDHRLFALQRLAARRMILGAAPAPTGFGNVHESESLPGAVPRRSNSPRQPAHGLVAEQVNGTGFTAPRDANRRVWLYRARPSAQHGPFEPLSHPRFRSVDPAGRAAVDLMGWAPLALPDEPTDFVDGLVTLGGAGDPRLRRGFAVHLYAANRSMEDRAFYDADGELLLVPQLGALTLLTELGPLAVRPGEIAILPRGLKVSVLLHHGEVRGWVGEVFGRGFSLPERGPVGANGLTDPRHFRAPSAFHEDRLVPGYRVTAKLGGDLYEARQDHSPFDVAGWHGDHVPLVYDLADFSPVANARFDPGAPSVYTVLTSPLDEAGAHGLDFVCFPPRWDVSEDTFRPPYFHRNAVTEINGVIHDPHGERPPFRLGTTFITPPMTAHGVRSASVERGRTAPEGPRRLADASLWWQFESALPMVLTDWARDHALPDWRAVWGATRSHYAPEG